MEVQSTQSRIPMKNEVTCLNQNTAFDENPSSFQAIHFQQFIYIFHEKQSPFCKKQNLDKK